LRFPVTISGLASAKKKEDSGAARHVCRVNQFRTQLELTTEARSSPHTEAP